MGKNKKKIISIDLDGTLFHNYPNISANSLEIIRKLAKKGHIVIINTGRGEYEVQQLLENNGLISKNFDIYSATNNGTQLWKNKKRLFAKEMHISGVECLDFLDEHEFNYVYSSSNKYYARKKDWIVDVWTNIWNLKVEISNKIPKSILQIVTAKIAKDDTFITSAYNKLINQFSNKLQFFWQTNLPYGDTTVTCLSIGPMNINKATPLIWFIEKYNIPRENIIAFGDSFNDNEMLRYAGVSFAMKNAPEEIKAITKYTTKYTNYEDGVYYALKNYLKEEKNEN